MDAVLTLGQLAGVLKAYGPFGILVVIWYVDMRQLRKMSENNQKTSEQYRTDMQKVQSEHKEYMSEIRRMYENNVILVQTQQSLSEDLKDIIIMNTQAMTHLSDDIEQNKFCPALQLNKKKIQVAK